MNEQSPPKKLSRSRNDRYVGGVAAGIGNYLNVDPVFVRIAFVASLALGGLGLLAYLVLLAGMPVEGDPSEPLPPIEPKRRNLMIGLAVAVGIAGIAIADSGDFAGWLFGFWPGTVFGILFWVAAAGVAIWLLASGKFNRDDQAPPPGTPSSGTPTSGFRAPDTDPPAPASTEVVTFAESPSQLSTEVMATRQMDSEPIGESDSPVRDNGASTIGRIMVWFAIGISALIVFSTLFVVSAGATALFGGVPMAALVILLGGAMVFAGLRGRRQISLWLLTAAIAVTLPMAAVSIADLRVEGSYGDINETPLSVVDVPDDGYKMAAGNMTIDLRKFDPASIGAKRDGWFRNHIDLPVTSGMGLTTVIVPDDMCVAGSIRGKAGLAYFRGHQTNGINITQTSRTFLSDKAPMFKRGSVVVRVDGEFKLGVFEVVDDTEWRLTGGNANQGDYARIETTDDDARERAAAACRMTLDPSTTTGTKVKP